MTTTIIPDSTFGVRPTGSCAPDGTTLWATRTYTDHTWTFTTYNGWLIVSVTDTDDIAIASIISDHLTQTLGGDR